MLKKDDIKSIWLIAKYNLKKSIVNPRIYILFILIFMYLWYLIDPIVTLSKTIGIKVAPWLFPHITSYKLAQLFIMLGVIVLLADSPFIDEGYNYLIIRSGRKKWVIGQILYMQISTALYIFIIFLITVILTLPNIFVSSEWGKILTTFANTDTSAMMDLHVSNKILTLYSPINATLLSFVLEWACTMIIGLIMFIINLRSKKSVGIIVVTLIVFLDRAIFSNFPNFKLSYISPISLASLDLLDLKKLSSISPSTNYAILFLLTSVVILSIIAILSVINKKIESN